MPTVLITSANRGLGLEFARQYLQQGWAVLAACRKPDAAIDLKKLDRGPGGSLRLIAMDVTEAASIRDAALALAKQPIDLLLNTAGIMGAGEQPLGRTDYRIWAQVLEVNTFGPLRVLEAFLPNLFAGSHKQVVSITSGMGSITDNRSGGHTAYRTSKAALNMAMRNAALELVKKGITCIVMNPGWVKTDMGGPGATLTAEASIGAMIRGIGQLDIAASGSFLNYDGRTYAW
jgi:NAD(P)-dependent dehydrogenase (short-subunit alcohol dehydrogenase family)